MTSISSIVVHVLTEFGSAADLPNCLATEVLMRVKPVGRGAQTHIY